MHVFFGLHMSRNCCGLDPFPLYKMMNRLTRALSRGNSKDSAATAGNSLSDRGTRAIAPPLSYFAAYAEAKKDPWTESNPVWKELSILRVCEYMNECE